MLPDTDNAVNRFQAGPGKLPDIHSYCGRNGGRLRLGNANEPGGAGAAVTALPAAESNAVIEEMGSMAKVFYVSHLKGPTIRQSVERWIGAKGSRVRGSE